MMKRKVLIPILAVMLCVGMIGVGFAAWVITATTSKPIESDEMFKVYDVQSYVVDHTSEFTEDTVAFGTDNKEYTYKWLKMDDAANSKEDLTATLKVTLDTEDLTKMAGRTFSLVVGSPLINNSTETTNLYTDYIDLPDAISLTITLSDAGKIASVTDASGNTIDFESTNTNAGKLIDTSGAVIDANGDGTADISCTETGVFTFQLIFGWGDAFDNENPNKFYNSHPSTGTISGQTYSKHAEAALGEVAKLKDKKYVVTVTTDIVVD